MFKLCDLSHIFHKGEISKAQVFECPLHILYGELELFPLRTDSDHQRSGLTGWEIILSCIKLLGYNWWPTDGWVGCTPDVMLTLDTHRLSALVWSILAFVLHALLYILLHFMYLVFFYASWNKVTGTIQLKLILFNFKMKLSENSFNSQILNVTTVPSLSGQRNCSFHL